MFYKHKKLMEIIYRLRVISEILEDEDTFITSYMQYDKDELVEQLQNDITDLEEMMEAL